MKNRLRALREEHRITQGQLADLLDISRQSVNAIETGKYDPSLPVAFSLARVFGCQIEDIFAPDLAALDPAGHADSLPQPR